MCCSYGTSKYESKDHRRISAQNNYTKQRKGWKAGLSINTIAPTLLR